MPNLVGLHDIESIAIALPDTWVLHTVALSENPEPPIYTSSLNWITRCNWNYGDRGTLPTPDRYNEYLDHLATYVKASSNCRVWVIGNETNLRREWPDNKPIYPHNYAECYVKAKAAIHALPGHEGDEVLIAASGPWNDELKYSGNPTGDWIQYFLDVINVCGKEVDGFSLHAYTHGYDNGLVFSDAMMEPPFEDRHYNFRTYRDYCNVIPEGLAHLPIYITEANGNGPWRAVGLMPSMADEIGTWNKRSHKRKIKALIFYRYPKYDDFYMDGKGDVIAEYRDAVAKGYRTPETVQENVIMKGTVAAQVLNIRSGPGTNTPVVGQLSKGNSVEILEKSSAGETVWYRIGDKRWVSANWVSVGGVTEPAPPAGDNWSRSLAFVLRWEGGWADDVQDPGGATMKGVTIGTYTRWREAHGQPKPTKDNLRNISDAEVAQIYREWYWVASGADKMAWPMCLAQMDLAVNGGIGRAQEALTTNGLNFNRYMAWRIDWYTRLDDFVHFGKGWLRRCADLLREVGKSS